MFEAQEKLERIVMELSLERMDPNGSDLTKQYESAQVLSRKFTGKGFLQSI